MILKYSLLTRKNITIAQIVTYIFLCIISIIVILSIIEAFNIPYNRYKYNKEVGSNYAYATATGNNSMTCFHGVAIGNTYLEEMTKPRMPLQFKRMTNADVYICKNQSDIAGSYFEGNILKYDKKIILSKESTTLPVFLSYNLLDELEVTIGESLKLYNYQTIYTDLVVCGILRPAYKDFQYTSEILIVGNEDLIGRLKTGLADDSFITFEDIIFSNEQLKTTTGDFSSPLYSKEVESEKIISFLSFDTFFSGWMTLLFGIIIIVFAAYIEFGFIYKRNKHSLGCLRRLGISKRTLNTITIVILLLEFIIVMPVVLLFVKYWINYVLFIHISFEIIFLIYIIELITVFITSIVSIFTRSMQDEFYTI